MRCSVLIAKSECSLLCLLNTRCISLSMTLKHDQTVNVSLFCSFKYNFYLYWFI